MKNAIKKLEKVESLCCGAPVEERSTEVPVPSPPPDAQIVTGIKEEPLSKEMRKMFEKRMAAEVATDEEKIALNTGTIPQPTYAPMPHDERAVRTETVCTKCDNPTQAVDKKVKYTNQRKD